MEYFLIPGNWAVRALCFSMLNLYIKVSSQLCFDFFQTMSFLFSCWNDPLMNIFLCMKIYQETGTGTSTFQWVGQIWCWVLFPLKVGGRWSGCLELQWRCSHSSTASQVPRRVFPHRTENVELGFHLAFLFFWRISKQGPSQIQQHHLTGSTGIQAHPHSLELSPVAWSALWVPAKPPDADTPPALLSEASALTEAAKGLKSFLNCKVT